MNESQSQQTSTQILTFVLELLSVVSISIISFICHKTHNAQTS